MWSENTQTHKPLQRKVSGGNLGSKLRGGKKAKKKWINANKLFNGRVEDEMPLVGSLRTVGREGWAGQKNRFNGITKIDDDVEIDGNINGKAKIDGNF